MTFTNSHNGDSGLEFLRFGSSIPGNYWGCCAADIIQNFNVDPDAKASIQIVSGDGGGSCGVFAGPTYRDIFLQRLRIGTFSTTDMPNHAFYVMLSQSQISGGNGLKWLAILKEQGFEFLRKVNNSVWNVDNYVFVLIRNVGPNAVDDQFTPPKQWRDLPTVVPEPWQQIEAPKAFTAAVKTAQKPLYDALPKGTLLTEAQVVAAGAPVILAGMRSERHRPLKKEIREKLEAEEGVKKATSIRAGDMKPVAM